jgi:hypothetical protein
MAQEQQQRTDAKEYGERDRRNAFPHPRFVLANEPEEENVNSSEQGDQTNNRQQKVNHDEPPASASVFRMKVKIKPLRYKSNCFGRLHVNAEGGLRQGD